jgi:glycosyltransferase involved in cell wall biosynthesis
MREEHARWQVPWTPNPEFLIRNEEAEYAQADAVTVPSDFVKGTFVAEGVPAEKVYVVPYGVNLAEFEPVGVPPTDGTFRIVFVGQVSLRKGIPTLLEAFHRFPHPRKELVIVGGVQESARPVIARFDLTGVQFVGTVPRPEVKRYLSTSHVMTLPSIEEGLALVQAQALACGCPVVATPNTGSENLFTNGVEGLIVPPRDPAALVAAWTRLADEPETLAAMRVAALSRAQAVGGWKNYAAGILGVVDDARRTRANLPV